MDISKRLLVVICFTLLFVVWFWGSFSHDFCSSYSGWAYGQRYACSSIVNIALDRRIYYSAGIIVWGFVTNIILSSKKSPFNLRNLEISSNEVRSRKWPFFSLNAFGFKVSPLFLIILGVILTPLFGIGIPFIFIGVKQYKLHINEIKWNWLTKIRNHYFKFIKSNNDFLYFLLPLIGTINTIFSNTYFDYKIFYTITFFLMLLIYSKVEKHKMILSVLLPSWAYIGFTRILLALHLGDQSMIFKNLLILLLPYTFIWIVGYIFSRLSFKIKSLLFAVFCLASLLVYSVV